MLWLFFTIAAYLLLAIPALIEKYLLAKTVASPQILTFYVGVLGMLGFLLVPWVGFSIPDVPQILLSMGAGAAFSVSLLIFFRGLRLFETSRLVPAIGALVPLFMFVFLFLVLREETLISFSKVFSFALLVGGTFLISREQGKHIHGKSFWYAFWSGLFFAISFVMTKFVYLSQPFWTGFLLIRVGSFLVSVFLLLVSREVRNEILGRGQKGSGVSFWEMPKTYAVFLVGQGAAALGEVMRNLAVFWVPLAMLPFIHALQGVQYVFLFFAVIVLSAAFPRILKEEMSKRSVFERVFAIVLISGGLALLALQ